MPRRANRRTAAPRGFTLIELLVVMAIISILASMLFPTFAKARGKARGIDCVSNLSQLGKAFSMYAMDYDGIMPPHDESTFSNTFQRAGYVVDDWTTSNQSNWARAIYSYVRAYQVYVCKSAVGAAPGSNGAIPPLSYIMNGYLAGMLQDAPPSPSSVCLLYDWKFTSSWAAANPGKTQVSIFWGWAPHEERFNVLYVDGHAKNVHETVWAQHMYPPGPVDGMFYF
jgi:prepilin-type N-terminal cleavage/methylation domain-containing protein/prepilin-type processing-associated H-X9-DG protein